MKSFFDTKDTKISEKSFSQSLIISVISILLCLVMLCSMTYAWFSEDISSSSNSIQSANCDISVSVTPASVTNDDPSVAANGEYTFKAGEVYKIEITATGTAKNAYCILKIDGTDYYTEQISVSEQGGVMSFTLQFSSDTTVTILPRWGISSEGTRHFADGGVYVDCISTEATDETDGRAAGSALEFGE